MLAESHVYTVEAETTCLIQQPGLPQTIPPEFVRLVYCLGYGENSILNRPPLAKNTGTHQFWKIFKSCVDQVQSNTDFHEIQSSRTRHDGTRIANKIRILEKLREQGTWLLDASIVALYSQGASRFGTNLTRASIVTSWDTYVRHTIEAANPEAILVIGIGVARILQPQLDKVGIPWGAVPQPQARLSASEHWDIYAIYSSVAREPKRILNLSRCWLKGRPPAPAPGAFA